MPIRWKAALAALLFTLLAGCGGGGTDRTKAQVRLVNASTGYAALELRVDGQTRQSDVLYGGSAAYVETEPGKTHAIYSPGSPTALLSFSPAVSARKHYSLLAYGAAGALKQVLLDDDISAPDTDHSLLRIVNAAPDAGALDIYVTAAAEPLQSAVALQSALAVDAVSSNLDVTSGNWRLRVTAAGSKTDLRLDVSSFTLASRQIRTLVLVPGTGGVLLKALLLTQQSGHRGSAGHAGARTRGHRPDRSQRQRWPAPRCWRRSTRPPSRHTARCRPVSRASSSAPGWRRR